MKMKAMLSLGLLALPLALSGKTVAQKYIESYQGRSDIPVPVSVIMPEVDAVHRDQTVKIEFIVDASGVPGAFAPVTDANRVAAEAVIKAVAQWKFAPAQVGGRPVARKVALPVNIVVLN